MTLSFEDLKVYKKTKKNDALYQDAEAINSLTRLNCLRKKLLSQNSVGLKHLHAHCHQLNNLRRQVWQFCQRLEARQNIFCVGCGVYLTVATVDLYFSKQFFQI